jgi:hypothetical protein
MGNVLYAPHIGYVTHEEYEIQSGDIFDVAVVNPDVAVVNSEVLEGRAAWKRLSDG